MTSSSMPAGTDMDKQKVLVITGPTASGKTSLSIALAKELDGEIISGDSIQIYKGLDIGSAKVRKDEMDGVVHHLIDIKEANENYSVKEFQERGRALIDDIAGRGKLPIVAGGTGLYIKALLYDYEFFDETEADDPYDDLSNQQIYDELLIKDPGALEKIHINNRKRLVRALNVVNKHNKGISEISKEQEHVPLYDILVIGISAEREILNTRIDARVDQMISEGLIAEVSGLLEKGITFDHQSMQGIGYREFRAFVDGEKSLDECIEDIKRDTRRFAKRQMTWFRNQFDVVWISDPKEAYEVVRKWLI